MSSRETNDNRVLPRAESKDVDADVIPESSREQLDRLAAHVAVGSARFPSELAAGDAEQLRREVSRLRRRRLIKWIAQAVARDIYDPGGRNE